MERLSWGCGPDVRPGWDHSDIEPWPDLVDAGGHVGPIQAGLPWGDATFDYVVSHHALQMVPWPDLVPALAELRRVTRPGGWLRISVPDVMGAVEAFLTGNEAWFPIADEVEDTIDGKLCVYVTQAGATRSVFTARWLIDLCVQAGWPAAKVAWIGHTHTDAGPGILELDGRPGESLIVEAGR